MRADRLVATLLLLQARKRVTAADVARELEVSERTARRDLEALSAAGIPVYPQPGRGGGWELLGGARTDLSGLTAAEAQTLFMVAGPAAAATPELKAALRKLVRALPEPFRGPAQAAAASIVIDPGGWGRTRQVWSPPYLPALQTALAAGMQVRLGYGDRTGNASTRLVSPLGLAMKGTVWYLVANTDAGLRTFRVGRVTSVEQTDVPVDRPADFDLEAQWQRVVADVDELRAPYRIQARVDPDAVLLLRWIFDRRLRVEEETPDERGRVAVSVGGQHLEMLTAQLAGLGARVEVTDPA
ncbi:MAG TPA: WYL domain-containing protein, partial [Mycobacteriales bacterium]|nr:WYL domain-containing protein [Mycobacteriales bacterium]